MTMKRNLRLYQLPDKPKLPGFRKFTSADLEQTYRLVNKVMKHTHVCKGRVISEHQRTYCDEEKPIDYKNFLK